MNTYAEVALPIAVNKTFTYLVPPDLVESAITGVRVVVPFGRGYATGIIVGRPPDSTVKGIRPVRDVVDAQPILRAEMLELSRWISDYYLAPLGEVLKTALPQGFSPSSKRVARPCTSSGDGATNLSPRRRQIMDILNQHGALSARDLGKRVGIRNIHSVLNEMANDGYVNIEEAVPNPRKRGRTAEFIRIGSISPKGLAEALQNLSPRRRKAKVVLETVADLRSSGTTELPTAELLKRAGTSSSALREFKRSGLFPVIRREVREAQDLGTEDQTLSINLNQAQKEALAPIRDAILERKKKTFLLHGVTGSGKTQVYIEAIRTCLEQEKAAIVLVPEISLTPQIVRRFNTHFPGLVGVVHSRISLSERFEVWSRAAHGECRVVIGPRSALFAPVHPLGLIVIDEEHESSYKQYDAVPRYHARDTALVRASIANAVTVLGSATPSMESYYNALVGKYELLRLKERVDGISMPPVEIVDMREERKREFVRMREESAKNGSKRKNHFQQSAISEELGSKIKERIERHEGVILLQNRRGFAPFVECPECGYNETCERCSVTLTYHIARKHLRCHYCGTVYQPHSVCPQCRGETIVLKGIGTQRVEEQLRTMFPEAGILRMDLDTTAGRGAHERILRKFSEGEADILLGTQIVAKGLDFPRVTLVGVISADTQILLPDFRAAERTFQLLTQVAGRAGRSRLKGEVLIQTHQPDHYALQHVLDHNFIAFHEEEIRAREELDYPPFSRLTLVEFKGKKEELVRREAERFRRLLGEGKGVLTFLGPAPAIIPRINDQYRWHILIKSLRRLDPAGSQLRAIVRNAVTEHSTTKHSSVRMIVDVDPVGTM